MTKAIRPRSTFGASTCEVAAIVDARRGDGIVRAYGRSEVRGVELANGARVDCDLLVIAVGLDRARPSAEYGRRQAQI